MKRFVMIAMLTVAVSSFAFAGEIPTDGSPLPPPPSGATQTTTGEMQSAPGEIPMVSPAEQISSAALSGLLTAFGWLTS